MLLLTALAAVALALSLCAHAWSRRCSRAPAIALPLLLVLLCGRAVLDAKPAWEWALFPWPGYVFLQGFVLYLLAAVFFGVASGRLPLRWNRRVVLAVGFAVIVHGVHRNSWIAFPEVHGDARCADGDHHLIQSTHYTCGPAACAAALSHIGIRICERDMAHLCLTRVEGTKLFDLYRGLSLALAEHAVTLSIEELTADELLASNHLVVCSNSGAGHALCIATSKGEAVVHDPLNPSPEQWTRDRLVRDYSPPAIVLRLQAKVEPPAPR